MASPEFKIKLFFLFKFLNLNCQHPAIFTGDFNCHNNLWGYTENDENGELLLRWTESHNLHLIFDAKDRRKAFILHGGKGTTTPICDYK
jgi:hypothetical protein